MSPNLSTDPQASRQQGSRAESAAESQEEVQAINREISGNFVIEPHLVIIRRDLIIALKRFQKSVRTRYRQVLRNRKLQEEEQEEEDRWMPGGGQHE